MPSANITPGGTKIASLPYNIGTWANNTATAGTDTACTNGTLYYASLRVPGDVVITGITYLVGSVGGTDKVIVSLHDSSGTLLANSALAGTTVATTATTHNVSLTTPYLFQGPDIALVGLTFNGTTAKFRSILAYGNAGSGMMAGSATQSFGTAASFVPSTTIFTADKGGICSLF